MVESVVAVDGGTTAAVGGVCAWKGMAVLEGKVWTNAALWVENLK